MHSLTLPKIILFDWHGTLADTYDAMYNALDDLFPRLAAGGLLDRLMNPESSKTLEDAKLVNGSVLILLGYNFKETGD